MAYLRAHYPLYFYLSLLNSTDMDEEKTKKYLKELKAHKLKVSKPDINKSNDNYVIHYDTIYLPFKTIKGISSVISNKIIEVRDNKFNDIYDFFSKMVLGSIPKNVYLSLIKSGTLDLFNINRKTLYENVDNLINYGNLVKDLGEENVLKPEIMQSEEFTREELINFEKECFGFYLSNHPVVYYRNKINHSIKLADIKKYFNKNIVCVVLIDKIKEINTKDNLPMAFISGSDEEMSVDIIVFPKVYETLEGLKKGDIIKVEGRVERKRDYNIIASSIINIKEIL
jgi:DNA polymerase-3 subunit alpha